MPTTPPSVAMAENLRGILERIVFHNPDSGFAVLRVQLVGHEEPVTVIGYIPQAAAGEILEATGSWIQDKTHGKQFKADQLTLKPPHSRDGIIKYLGSGLVKGIGKHMAKKIVEVFGDRTLQIIDESPAFLREVKGIGPRRIHMIRESWQEQKGVRSIMVFLQSHGIGTARAVRIYKTYGDKAIELVRSNPYRLANDIWGVGFRTADELAGKLGIEPLSPIRIRAAIRYLMQQLSLEGHVGYPEENVIERAMEMLQAPREPVIQAVAHSLEHKLIVRDAGGEEPWLYLVQLHQAESGAAQRLTSLLSGRHPLPVLDISMALAQIEAKIQLELAPGQRKAIELAATHKVLVLTGGPGVGKTTIVRAILEIFASQKTKALVCAPTGRAAKRLQETTGRDAKTIHRLLELDTRGGGFQRNAERPLDVDLLVVDEASMLDINLFDSVLQALPDRACLLLVGDIDQLPSVGPGMVLADLIASRKIPVARLTEIFRQSSQSWIVRAAHLINEGQMPESAPAGKGDFYFIETDQPEQILERILYLVRERIPDRFKLDARRDIQVLAPMNRTELGVRNLNDRLQAMLTPPGSGQQIERYGWTFREGDKVLQTVNNYEKDVFNGDIGRILSMDNEEQELSVDFDGRTVVYEYGELDELALAYALSIHKSQGSEYPAVVIPLHTQHYVMLQRNLLYTAITRGKKLVVLVGSRKALSLAVSRQDTSRRCTALARRLRELA